MKPFESVARKPFLPFAAAILALVAIAFGGGSASAADEPFDPWKPGNWWMSVRAGYAKSAADTAGYGAGGYGMSYHRMLSGLKLYKWTLFRKCSMGATVQHDLLGRFGPAAETDVSATLELTRHYRWAPNVHPYLGVGLGPYYRKTYRTGNDLRDVSLGWLVATGIHTPISGRHVLGIDVRASRLDGKNAPPNPVFGRGGADQRVTHWSIKATYSFVD